MINVKLSKVNEHLYEVKFVVHGAGAGMFFNKLKGYYEETLDEKGEIDTVHLWVENKRPYRLYLRTQKLIQEAREQLMQQIYFEIHKKPMEIDDGNSFVGRC